MQDEIQAAFILVNNHVALACFYLEDLIKEYMNSDLDYSIKLARISALKAKQDYLKGLKFDPQSDPWVED